MAQDELIAGQIDYYRRRAAEYDETSFGEADFGGLIERLSPRDGVLEIACGTGLWTQHLAPRASTLVALDSSPEMVALARSRVGDTADFVIADVFEWEPPRRFDCIFFGFWLSHVPSSRFEPFWRLLGSLLAPGGRVLFVDEGPPRASRENPENDVVRRRLRDGTVHTVVKVFHDPRELASALSHLGWRAEIELTDDGLIVGEARPEP